MTQPTKFASKELDRRRPVWVAISDLFLDTELPEDRFREIAHTLKASGYTLDELDYIYWQEVGPAVGTNAQCIAGVWEGFDEEWLVEKILARRATSVERLIGSPGCRVIKPNWERVKRMVVEAAHE